MSSPVITSVTVCSTLDARIHLDEEPFVAIQVIEKLDGAGVVVANLPRHPHGGIAQVTNHIRGQPLARRDLDHFLMPSLGGAIALVQMQDVPVPVAQDLHFEMFGPGDVFLEKHRRIPERTPRLRLGFIQQRSQIARLRHDPHSATATTKGGLDDQRKADLARDLQSLCPIRDRVFGAGKNGDTDLSRQCPGRGLVTHAIQQFRLRSDEGDAGLATRTRKGGVFTQESVAGMDGIDSSIPGHGDNAIDIKVGSHRPFAFAHKVGFVRLEPMHAEAVFLRIDRHRAEPQFRAGAEDPDGDLGTIRHHQLPKLARAG